MSLIKVKNLTKTYITDSVRTPALRGVSFNIEKGEFLAIMGPSGSGKSTLLHLLGFLDKHTSGTYHFEGKTINDYSENELAHIRNKKMGFIFQTFNLLPRLTVLENTKLPLLYSDVKNFKWDEIAKKAIDSVGMTHRLNYPTSRLSGGEKQRTAIARALVNNPEVIFADEPTGNLDSKSGQIIMEILQNLNNKHGHTILLITHESYTAEHARRIIQIKDGKIIHDKKIKNHHEAHDGFKK